MLYLDKTNAMRNLLFLFIILPIGVLAQDALKITYGQQITFKAKDLPNESQEMKEAMRKAMEEINYFELILMGNEANYFPIEKIQNEQPTEGHTIRVSFSVPNQKMYVNYDDQIRLRTNTLYGQENIIKSNLLAKEWEITRETKEILGFAVRKATFENENIEEIAWYAPSLAYKAGPDQVWGLPGLILEYKSVSKSDEERTLHLFANDIETLDNATVNFLIPDESKSMTEDEYMEMVKSHNQRMRDRYGQGVDTSD